MTGAFIPPGLAEALQASAEGRDLVAELRAALRTCRKAIEVSVDWGGELHEDEDCPEDDTCRCQRAALTNEAHALALRLGEEDPHTEPCTCADCRQDGPTGLLPLEVTP